MVLIMFVLMSFLLAGQALAASEVAFEWDSNTEPDISHYNIYRSDDGQATWEKVNLNPIPHIGNGTETWTEAGVPDGTYHWYATAVDTEDNESGPSNIVSATIDTQAPAPPQGFSIGRIIRMIISWIMGLFGLFSIV